MAITRYPPNTIWLGGERTVINDLAASEAIKPGMLIERFNSSGTIRLRKHSTAAGSGVPLIATEQLMNNLGVDDLYAANDLVEAAVGHKGSNWWMLVASGASIAAGAKLESAGDGKLRAVTAGFPLFTALENITAVADTRIRVEVM